MKLSIITINYNNATGLKRTLDSVAAQKRIHPQPFLQKEGGEMCACEIEHIIVDGGSTDGSVDVIKNYVLQIDECKLPIEVKWVSEKDKGIYNAMNKGIQIAMGTRVVDDEHHSLETETHSNLSSLNPNLSYIQILNSGDMLASDDVVTQMAIAVSKMSTESEWPELVYGNMIKQAADGTVVGKSKQVPYSLLNYFTSTMNHDCCWIRRELFDDNYYGLYDENLKIVSDWKWFLQAIGLGNVRPVYVNIDMTIFDTGGISEQNLTLRNAEREEVLRQVLPPAVFADYNKHAFDMQQMDRLRRHHLYGLVYFIERVLFKLEKWHILK